MGRYLHMWLLHMDWHSAGVGVLVDRRWREAGYDFMDEFTVVHFFFFDPLWCLARVFEGLEMDTKSLHSGYTRSSNQNGKISVGLLHIISSITQLSSNCLDIVSPPALKLFLQHQFSLVV